MPAPLELDQMSWKEALSHLPTGLTFSMLGFVLAVGVAGFGIGEWTRGVEARQEVAEARQELQGKLSTVTGDLKACRTSEAALTEMNEKRICWESTAQRKHQAARNLYAGLSSLVRQAEAMGAPHGPTDVRVLRLRIGALAQYEPRLFLDDEMLLAEVDQVLIRLDAVNEALATVAAFSTGARTDMAQRLGDYNRLADGNLATLGQHARTARDHLLVHYLREPPVEDGGR